MHPSWQRIIGTTALTASLSLIMVRGILRDIDLPLHGLLLCVGLMAAFSYRFWPSLMWLWDGKLPFAITWRRFVALLGAGVCLTVVIVLGASWFGYVFDPWLVMAYLILVALMAWIGDWHDNTIRLHWSRP